MGIFNQYGSKPTPLDGTEDLLISTIDENYNCTINEIIGFADLSRFALTTHNHSGVYSLIDHNHHGVYEPVITKVPGYLTWSGANWIFVNETYSLSSHNHNTLYTPLIADPNINALYGWDNTDNAFKFITLGSNLSYDHSTHTLNVTGGSLSYPDAGIPLSTGSSWDTSIVNNSANWNTAFSWGNHASAGYLTSLGDALVDGDFTSQGIMLRGAMSGSYSILTDSSADWNTAYGWGNHASVGYLTSLAGAILVDQTSPQTFTNGIPLLSATRIIDTNNQIVDKLYADTVQSGGMKSFFFTKEASDVGGMYKAVTTIPTGGVQTITGTAVDGETILVSYLTDVATSEYRVIDGSRFFYIIAKTSSVAKPIQLRCYIYTTDLAGLNPVLLRTSNISNLLTELDAQYIMSAWGSSLLIPVTMRIKFVVAAIKSGGGVDPTITISVEDDTFSRLDVPSPTGATDLSDTFRKSVSGDIHGLTAAAIINDVDEFLGELSTGGAWSKLRFAFSLVKSTLKTYFDGLYASLAGAIFTGDVTIEKNLRRGSTDGDVVGDTKEGNIAGVTRFETCTVANAVKDAGTWVCTEAKRTISLVDSNELEGVGSYIDLDSGKSGMGEILAGNAVCYAKFKFTTAGIVTLLPSDDNVFTTLQTGTNHVVTKNNGSNVRITNELGSTTIFTIKINYTS